MSRPEDVDLLHKLYATTLTINDHVVMDVFVAKCCIATKTINNNYVVMDVFVAKCSIATKPINNNYVVMDRKSLKRRQNVVTCRQMSSMSSIRNVIDDVVRHENM